MVYHNRKMSRMALTSKAVDGFLTFTFQNYIQEESVIKS